MSPATFFRGDTHVASPHKDQAKAACRLCPVRKECLDYAIANHETEGIWGGQTTVERRRTVKVRRALEANPETPPPPVRRRTYLSARRRPK